MASLRIFTAAKQGNLEQVKFLIEEKGVPASITNKKKKTIAHVAVRYDNLEILNYILGKDLSLLTKTDDHNSTILQLAVQRGTLDVVKYLVEKYGPNITGTAAHQAIQCGHVNILRYLIEERKIDVNVPHADNEEPLLIQAMRRQNTAAINYLIEEAKARLTVLNADKENILFLAVQPGKLDCMKDLLDRKKEGFSINWRRRDGKTLVHIAVIESRTDILQYLVEEKSADVDVGDIHEYTPLHYAQLKYSDERYEYSKYLIMHGANIHKISKDRFSKFFKNLPFQTIFNDDMAFLKNLLDVQEIEFDVNTERYFLTNENLLETAYSWHRMHFVRYLIKEKHAVASSVLLDELFKSSQTVFGERIDDFKMIVESVGDLNQEDEKGNTLLHKAAFRPNLEYCRWLAEEGSALNPKNNDGETPLHVAVSALTRSIIEPDASSNACGALIEAGADINEKNNNGETPLHLAVLYNLIKTRDYLVEKGADINAKDKRGTTPLHIAVADGWLGDCQYFVDLGAKMNFKNEKGETPLHLALLKNKTEIFEYLADHGADIVHLYGNPLVHEAALRNLMVVLDYLVVKKKVDVNLVREFDNWTPLHCAALANKSESFQYLVEHGANIEAKDVNGKTPLEVVIDKRFIEFAHSLSKNRTRRSVGEVHPYPIPIRYNHLRIAGNIDRQGVNEDPAIIYGDIYANQFQNLLSFLFFIVKKFDSPVLGRSVDKEELTNPTRSILQNKMDPMAETAIKALPNFRE